MNTRSFKPLFFIIIPYLITLGLNIPLGRHTRENRPQESSDIIYRIFGNLRGLLADWAYIKGEVYLHGGLPINTIMNERDVCTSIETGRDPGQGLYASGEHGEEHGHDHEDAEDHHEDIEDHHEHHHGAADNQHVNLYTKLYSHTKVTEHSHLSSTEEKEVLPWFYLQVRFNPNDIQGYTVGTYWLKRVGNYEQAKKFLAEGEKNNPSSAQIKTMIAEFLFGEGKYAEALPYLEQAADLWRDARTPNIVKDDYAATDRAFTYTMLGEVYEITREYKKAAVIYREIMSFEPRRSQALLKKLEKIEAFSAAFQN